jgi:hypothetical protein
MSHDKRADRPGEEAASLAIARTLAVPGKTSRSANRRAFLGGRWAATI